MSSQNQNTRNRRTDTAARRAEERDRGSGKTARRVHHSNRRRRKKQAGKWKLAAVLVLAFFMTLLLAGRSSDLSHQEQTEEDLEMDAIFAVEFLGQGWSSWMPDNYAVYRTSTYPVAFKASIQNTTAVITVSIIDDGFVPSFSVCPHLAQTGTEYDSQHFAVNKECRGL